MRGKGYIGRSLAGMMAAVLMLTSVPFTVYATEAGTSAETVSEQEENLREEEAAQEDEEKDKSEGESKENGDDSEFGEEQIGEWNGEADQEEDEKDGEKSDNGEKEDDHDTDDTEEETGDQDISEGMVSENSVEKTEEVLRTDLQSSLSVKGRNSVGNMLAEALSDKAEEQLESNGYNVFSVEMDGQTAEVSFETLEDAVLTVAIYDESGKRLLTSGSCDVSVGDKIAEIEITEAIPQYFYVRSFLTDKETLQPLCPLYDSPMYTKDMQEFLTKTTDDFEEERVLNLDDDKTNNFAVYSEKAVIIPYNTDVNILMSADDKNYIYVIGNADESVASLQAGDIFVYEYTEGVTLIVKVASIKIDDATVTIQGEELSMEEVFDYVKINSKEGLGSAEIDASNLEDGVFYEGIVPYSSEGIETYKWDEIDTEWDKEAATSFKFKDKVLGDSMKFSGSLELKLKSSLKVYLSRDYAYLELKFEYSLKLEGNLSAEKKGENAFQIPLGSIRIDFIPLVYVKLTPNFVIEAEGKAGWSGTLKGVIGLAASSDEGVRSLTSTPKFESEWKAEVSVFLGISFKPEIGIISEKIAAASVEAVAGAEVKAKYSSKTPSTSKIHECIACIDGDINGKRECKFKIKLGNKEKWSWEVKVGDSIHISDFYYSQDFNEFDWGKCPHYLYKMEMTVTDKNGTAIQGAKITTPEGFYVQGYAGSGQTINNAEDAVWTESLTTDEKGKAIAYLIPGKYTLEIAKEKYGTIEKKINVIDKDKILRIKFKTDGESAKDELKIKKFVASRYTNAILTTDGSLYLCNAGNLTGNSLSPVKVLDHVKDVSLSDSLSYYHGGAITEDGTLYMWGRNRCGELGIGTTTDSDTPVKVLDHVKAVNLTECFSSAITEDGSLYMWGLNASGQLGNGTTTESLVPVKVLDYVKTVSLVGDFGYGYCGAITEDGSLYMWGLNASGQLGIGTTTNSKTPVKVLDDVKSISLDNNCSGAITEDGTLYMWGSNYCGQLGDGTTTGRKTPVKVLDDVKSISLYSNTSGAVTEDGSLYMWGDNYYGQLGDGTTTPSYRPKKVMGRVREIHISSTIVSSDDVDAGEGGTYSGAVTEDGSLYMWGDNHYGQLGNGKTEASHVPVKVFDHVTTLNLEGMNRCGAITEDGGLYMWGLNENGELGDGTTEDKLFPIKISLLSSNLTGTNSTVIQNDSSLMIERQSMIEVLEETEKSEELEESDEIEETVENLLSFPTEATIAFASYTAQAIGTTGNIRFFDLIPEEIYNFYVVESREKENTLEASNLLYINQYTADSSGSLAVTYEAKLQSDTAIAFVTGMSKMNLVDAEVSVTDLISNGSIQYAMPEVTYKGTLLTEGVDYEVTDNVGGSVAGAYSVTLAGIGLYTGEVTIGYRIVENPYMGDDIEADTLRAPTASEPSGTEMDTGKKVRLLTETAGAKIYYTLDGTFPTKESILYTSPIVIEQDTTITAYAVKEGYIDSPTVTFRYTIKDTSGNGDVLTEDISSDGVIPDGLWMSEIKTQNYTGKAIKPEVRVYDHKTLLTEKKDYTLTYKNNIKANDTSVAKTAPTITVTGKGNYSGKETQTFVILPKDISDEDVLADPITTNATEKTQYPVPKITWQGKSLAKNRDFKVSYPSSNGEIPYQTAGTYEIQIEGNGNYTGQRTIAFTITNSKAVSKLTVGKIPNQLYTGEAVTPALTVKDGKYTLQEGEDYNVLYQNNVSVGTATAVISGMGDYAGTRRVNYKITAVASVNKAKANLLFENPAVYTGQEVKPNGYILTVNVKTADKKSVSVQLQEGIDYTVSYQNNNKAGTASIIFTGINGYSGTLKKTYKIAPYDIKADAEKAAEADKKIVVRLQHSYVYAKGGCKPEPIVTFQGKVLKKGTDYTLSYKNNTKLNDGSDKAKLPTVTVKGKGNFKGSCSTTYQIQKQELKKLTLTAKDKVWQNKKNIYKTTITLMDMDGKKLSAGKDYDKNVTYVYDSDTVLEDQSVRKAGTAVLAQDVIPADTVIKVTVKAVENGNYTGKLSATYRIIKADIGKAIVKIPTQTYTGKAIEPDNEIEVTLNRVLLSEDNYEIIAYQNNVNKGNASVTICGKNDCGGTKTVKFKIRSKGLIWWRK